MKLERKRDSMNQDVYDRLKKSGRLSKECHAEKVIRSIDKEILVNRREPKSALNCSIDPALEEKAMPR
jgi:hypothetical protein